MSIALRPLPPASQPWVRADGMPQEAFSTPMLLFEQLLRAVNGGGKGGIVLADAVNDAAAAAVGVPVGAFYRNGSVLMIRVA